MLNHRLHCLTWLALAALAGCSQLPGAGSGADASHSVLRTADLDADSLFILGRAAHGEQKWALAQERYEKVLQFQPRHVGALNALAVIHAQAGMAQAALEHFRAALAVDPDAAHVHNNLGYTLLHLGRTEEAREELELALRLTPDSATVRRNLDLLRQQPLAAAVPPTPAPQQAQTAGAPELEQVSPSVFALRAWPTREVAQPKVVATEAVVALPGNSNALRGLRVEVSNGVGIRHLARDTASRLASYGVVTARLTNQANYRHSRTQIQFGAGHAAGAAALSATLPVAVQTAQGAGLGGPVQVRLILGHDVAGKAVAAWLDTARVQQLARMDPGAWRWS